jgi:hypothetical protein
VRWRDSILVDGDLVVRPWEDGDQELLGTSQCDPEIGRYFGRALDLAEGEPPPDDPDAPVLAITGGGAVVGKDGTTLALRFVRRADEVVRQ